MPRPSLRALAVSALLAAAVLLPPSAASVASAAEPGSVVAAPQGAPTVVILVRHAEKAVVPGNDPPLSAEGEQRALALEEALQASGVQAIVVTQFRRTQATAAPLAARLGLTPEVVEASADVSVHARQVAEHVLGRHAGRTVLVVGHSNTIPAIVRALGGRATGDIPDPVYDTMFLVLRDSGSTAAHTVQVRFGEATPAS